jgi:DNA polymerase elongation subunit (family B)
MIKILELDIETAPNLVHVWGLWQQNVGINQIITPGYTLCYAAKWVGQDEIYFDSLHNSDELTMLRGIHKLLDEADVVVHYNGKKFDIPTLNREFLLHNMKPPSPYKQIDLLSVVRQQFRFASNKLDYVVQQLGLGKKEKHEGHDLWIECMKNIPKAWVRMKNYNLQDVRLLDSLYQYLLPWIPQHPNVGLYNEEEHVCPNCGSKHLQKRGYSFTNMSKFQRYRCNTCGTWSRDKKNIAVKNLNVKG